MPLKVKIKIFFALASLVIIIMNCLIFIVYPCSSSSLICKVMFVLINQPDAPETMLPGYEQYASQSTDQSGAGGIC